MAIPPSHEECCTSQDSTPDAQLKTPAVATPPHAMRRHRATLSLTDRLALVITHRVGTMACVAGFAVLALVALPGALATHSTVTIVMWTSQSFLQLVLLPLLMVGQRLEGRHAEQRSQADFEVNQKAYADAEAILTALKAIDGRTLELVKKLVAEAGA